MANSQNVGRSNTAEKNPTIKLVFIFEDINNPIPLLPTAVNKVRTLLDPEADPMETYLSLLCKMLKKDEPDKRCFESSDYRLVDINNAERVLAAQGRKFCGFPKTVDGSKEECVCLES
jgi:hypothetical protein